MKKVLESLVLRKRKPGRKALLLVGYLLVVALLVTAVTWRGLSSEPLTVTPDTGENAAVEGEAAAEPTPPFNALDEADVIEGVMPDADAEPVLTAPVEQMRWPVEGQVLKGHHEPYAVGNQYRLHVGVDIAAADGETVKAAWPGTVYEVWQDSVLGLVMEIRHGGGYVTQYANLADAYFSIGDQVRAGDPIGKIGQSAMLDASEGPFLHFAIYKDGTALDPVTEISPRQ